MKREINIVGGGITGLALAYIAAKNNCKVRVIEGSANFGGLLNTFEIGGTKLEYFYHHFFTHDAELRWLLKELEIEHLLEFHKTSMGVYNKGKLYNFNSPLDLLSFSPMSFFGKLRFGLTSLFMGKVAKWEENENVRAMEWFYKYAGKSATDSLWKPMLDIKFGPYANEIPLAWMIGRMRQRLNSRNKGDEKLGYLKGSLDVLLKALLDKLKTLEVEFISSALLEEVTIENSKIKSIKTSKGEITGGEFVFTIPGIYLFPMLKKNAPALAKQLSEIKYFGAVCTILETEKKLSDIYWMNVAEKGFPFGGIIEHTNLVPAGEYQNTHITYLSRYFAHSEPLAKMSAAEIKETMIAPLKKIFPKLDEAKIKNIHVFKTNTAATVCDLNFSKKVPQCKTEIEGMYICNMAHIYPDERSVNNSIRIAAEAANTMGLNSAFVPYGQSLSGKIGFAV